MLIDDLTEAKVKLDALSTLIWYFRPEGECEDLYWGLGMLVHHIVKELEDILEEVEAEKKNGKAKS